jgi:hypothetical protein
MGAASSSAARFTASLSLYFSMNTFIVFSIASRSVVSGSHPNCVHSKEGQDATKQENSGYRGGGACGMLVYLLFDEAHARNAKVRVFVPLPVIYRAINVPRGAIW